MISMKTSMFSYVKPDSMVPPFNTTFRCESDGEASSHLGVTSGKKKLETFSGRPLPQQTS